MIAPITERRISAGSPSLRGNEVLYVNTVLAAGWLTMGYYVKEFEAAFAAYVQAKYAFATSNGTSALHLMLAAHGISIGDEVITTACTFIATANAIAYCGATPIIVDVEPNTWNIDPVLVENAITYRTKAILVVHLYGNPVNMQRINAIADRHNLLVFEDCAEALGARIHGKHVGSFGAAAAYSFYGNKTITTGEGGMVTTNDDHIAERIKLLRGQGQTPGARYWHEVVGFNYRLTDLQAAVGLAQLEQVDEILRRRQEVVHAYREIWHSNWRMQGIVAGAIHGNWAFAVSIPDITAAQVMAEMADRGIETRPIFPPLNLQDPYWDAEPRPVADELHETGIVLPTTAEMTPDDAKYVMSVLNEVVNS